MTPPWPRGDPRDVVRSIVADPRFALGRTPHVPPRSWLDVVHDWVVAVLRQIFHRLDHALGAHNPLDAAIGFAAIGAAFALLGYCIYALVRSFAHSAGRRAGVRPDQSNGATERSAAALRTASLAAARAGRYRDAAALLFLAAACALDECGRVPYDPARTPGEYRRVVDDPLFDALVVDAVVALFAAAEPRAELYERMNGCYARFFDPAAG